MKKGIQYSHYCALEMLEIICAVDLCVELAQENIKESKDWGNYAKKMTNQLRIKISDLDKLNNMTY